MAFLFAAAMASHGLLDTLTDAGLGIALLLPFSEQRFFAPLRPLATASVDPLKFFRPQSLHILWTEVLWIWLPLVGLSLSGWAGRTCLGRVRGRESNSQPEEVSKE